MNTTDQLPDQDLCRTEAYSHGMKELYVCKVENSYLCRYSLSFGFSFYFCYHDDRAGMAMEHEC